MGSKVSLSVSSWPNSPSSLPLIKVWLAGRGRSIGFTATPKIGTLVSSIVIFSMV
jgi:hypothetical protein